MADLCPAGAAVAAHVAQTVESAVKAWNTARGANGRFKKGAKPGPGRPRRAAGFVSPPPLGFGDALDVETRLDAVAMLVAAWRRRLAVDPLVVSAEAVISLLREDRHVPVFVVVGVLYRLINAADFEAASVLASLCSRRRVELPGWVGACLADPPGSRSLLAGVAPLPRG